MKKKKLIAENMNYEDRTIQEEIIAIEMKEIKKLIAEKSKETGVNYKVSLDVRYDSAFFKRREYGHFTVSLRLNDKYSIYFPVNDEKFYLLFGAGRSITEGVNKIYEIIKANLKKGKEFYIFEINE